MKRQLSLFVVVATIMSSVPAWAVPTRIVVKVRTKEAKFLGTSMGGALITVKNVDTGELLAKGVTAGTTGNTDRIMEESHQRNVPLSDEKTAKYTATIDINEPTLVEVKAFGPLAQRQSANTITLTQWIIPGKDIVQGDGLLMEMPGFAVDVLAPPAHTKYSTKQLPVKFDVQANVIMMCGCPVSADGLWDANRYEVTALITRNGKQVGELPLKYAGKPSQFAASMEITEAGAYEIAVYAFDAVNGNTGVDKGTVIVE